MGKRYKVSLFESLTKKLISPDGYIFGIVTGFVLLIISELFLPLLLVGGNSPFQLEKLSIIFQLPFRIIIGFIFIVLSIKFLIAAFTKLIHKREHEIILTGNERSRSKPYYPPETKKIVDTQNTCEQVVDSVQKTPVQKREQIVDYLQQTPVKKREQIVKSVQQTPKEKGEQFEKFVVKKFDKRYFNLKEWRGDKEINGISAETNQYPDLEFEFHLKRIKKIFAVECKWRQNFYKNGIQWSKTEQVARYNTYATEKKIPVFVVIGVGGTPDNPAEIFVVPLKSLKYPYVKHDNLAKWKKELGHNFFFDAKKDLLQ